MPKKIFIIDIDGTICEDIRNELGPQRMLEALPYKDAIEQINKWFDEGNLICFFTARTDEHRDVTEQWLKQHNVRHHQVIYNKPRRIGDFTEYHFIDNAKVRATTYGGTFKEFVKKVVEIEVFPED